MRLSTGLAFTGVLLLCLLAGCKSNAPATAYGALAWAEIKDRSPLEIARAVSETFKQAGFEPIPLPRNDELKMQFEKVGGSGTALLYSDWSFKPVWHRARIKFAKTSTDTYMVTCNVFRVINRGDPHFEEEQKVLHGGPYQDLMDKVKAELNPGTN